MLLKVSTIAGVVSFWRGVSRPGGELSRKKLFMRAASVSPVICARVVLYPVSLLGYVRGVRVLLMDNNDSFTRNLEHLLAATLPQAEIVVNPYSRLVSAAKADLHVISPGPGTPHDYPGYARIIDSGVPLLGVCLGMQIINVHFGGRVEPLEGCVHGRTGTMHWHGREWTVARYHSLHCAEVPSPLVVEAALPCGTPMILSHPGRPVIGLQFHPESFLTLQGKEILAHAVDSLAIA